MDNKPPHLPTPVVPSVEKVDDTACILPCFGRAAVDAREMYTDFLLAVLTPLIYEGFDTVFAKAIAYEKRFEEESKQNKDVQNPGIDSIFQHFVAAFKKMSEPMIEEETNRIRANSQCADYFDDLIRAVVKSHITVLTCSTKEVKLIKDRFHESVNINSFIHKCYIETAKFVYSNPWLFYKEADFQRAGVKAERRVILQNMRHNCELAFGHIRTGIKNALKHVLPMKQILEEYLNTDIEQTTKRYVDMIRNMISTDLRGAVDNGVNLLEDEKGHEVREDFDIGLNDLIFARKVEEDETHDDAAARRAAPTAPRAAQPAVASSAVASSHPPPPPAVAIEKVGEKADKGDGERARHLSSVSSNHAKSPAPAPAPEPDPTRVIEDMFKSGKRTRQNDGNILMNAINSINERLNKKSPEKQPAAVNVTRKLDGDNHYGEVSE